MINKSVTFSKFGAILAVVSSAIGLGNIWKFPTMTGENGGALFILVYLVATLFTSLTVLLAEFYIGNKTKQTPVDAVNEISSNNTFWKFLPIMGFITVVLTVSFYSDVVGWIVKYFISSLTNSLQATDLESSTKMFTKIITSPLNVLLSQAFVIISISSILFFGAAKSIEKTVKISLPLLLILLLIVFAKSMTLEGRSEAFTFLFRPDFSKFTISLVIAALGLAFFKLAVGELVLATYFSYFPGKIEPIKMICKILSVDLLVSLLFGLTIFPIVFTYGFEPASGPGLIFMTLPVLFDKMTFGKVLLPIFFFLVWVATIGAMLSLVEYSVVFVEKTFKLERKKAVIYNSIVLLFFSSLASLSTTRVLDSVIIFGKNFFDFFDYLASNILMPFNGILIILFLVVNVKKDKFKEFFVKDCGSNEKVINVMLFIMKYITPLAILAIWAKGLGLF